MAIFTLVSASGSPGVTSSVMALASVWPRPVTVVEADPTGSSGILAGYFRGTVDQPGLIELVMAHRKGLLSATLPSLLLPVEGTSAQVLVGIRSHDQAVGLEGLWGPLLDVLREVADRTGQDVLVDAGRLGLDGSPMPLVFGADVSAVVVGSSLPAVSGARSWAATVRERASARTGVVVVGEGRPYSAREIARALATPLLGTLVWSGEAARVFSEGANVPGRRGLGRLSGASGRGQFLRSAYMRSVSALGEDLRRSAGRGPGAPVVDVVEEGSR